MTLYRHGRPSRFTAHLQRSPTLLTLVAVASAFGAYTAMYAFRKPFSVGTFSGQSVLGFDLKALLVVAQIVGYTLSKFIGICSTSRFPVSPALGANRLPVRQWSAARNGLGSYFRFSRRPPGH